MKKLSREDLKKINGGFAGPSKGAGCLAAGDYCGSGCTDPDDALIVPCCAGLVCSGSGIIAGRCIVTGGGPFEEA